MIYVVMQYQTTMLFFIGTISIFGFYDAYAADSLSFDQTKIVLEHSGIISCVDCPGANGAATITATLTGPSVPSGQLVTLYKVGTTSDYSSSFIKFTTSPSGSLDFLTAAGQSITVTAPGFTQSSATIFSTGTLGTDYQKTKKIITPSSSDCSSYGGDTDGDGICNYWENNSNYPSPCPSSGPGLCIRTGPAPVVPYFIGCTPGTTHWSTACPSTTKADLYYEIDWMLGHKPSDDVISAVSDTFAASNYVSLNGVTGITFHAQLSEELPHVDTIPWTNNFSTNPGFDQLKYWWFGDGTAERGYTYPTEVTGDWNNYKRSQKAQVFHYAIFTHQQSGASSLNLSGISEMPGNDVMISLGAFDGKVGTKDQQKATLLHEIGHNIYLNHGGNDSIGCKPNYLSVMSQSQQFKEFVTNRPLDFSRSALPQLTENSLSETAGVGASKPSGLSTVYAPAPPLVRATGQAFDWNRDGDLTDTGVIQDINYFPTITTCPSSANQVLNGFKDWNRNQMKLSPLGFGTSSMEDVVEFMNDITYTADADTGNPTHVVTDELGLEGITNMRIARIDSITSTLDNIPDSDLVGNASEVRESYSNELNEVKEDIMKNSEGFNTMVDAYTKMVLFERSLDGIISNVQSLDSTKILVADVIKSLANTLPIEPIVEEETEVISPLDQIKSGVEPSAVKCKEGFENLLQSNNEFGGCFKSESVDAMVKRGWIRA